jgi:type 1 fimbria pilin
MKTKILKFGMPLMAFLLAIVFAFASNEKPDTSTALVDGYILSNGCSLELDHGCTVNGNNTCKVDGKTVFQWGCITPLMRD